jgi:hypothetical protein
MNLKIILHLTWISFVLGLVVMVSGCGGGSHTTMQPSQIKSISVPETIPAGSTLEVKLTVGEGGIDGWCEYDHTDVSVTGDQITISPISKYKSESNSSYPAVITYKEITVSVPNLTAGSYRGKVVARNQDYPFNLNVQ